MLFGVASVWLTVRENVWCWPTGLVNVGLFVLVFFRARLYADTALQVVYLVLCLYGWHEWLHGGRDRGPLRVSRAPVGSLAGLLGLGAAAALALGFWLSRYTDAASPFLDSATTCYSLVAQWLMTRKRLESWLFWIAVDVVYVGMYVQRGLQLTAGLYGVFLVLATLGLVEWRRSLVAPRA